MEAGCPKEDEDPSQSQDVNFMGVCILTEYLVSLPAPVLRFWPLISPF